MEYIAFWFWWFCLAPFLATSIFWMSDFGPGGEIRSFKNAKNCMIQSHPSNPKSPLMKIHFVWNKFWKKKTIYFQRTGDVTKKWTIDFLSPVWKNIQLIEFFFKPSYFKRLLKSLKIFLTSYFQGTDYFENNVKTRSCFEEFIFEELVILNRMQNTN